MCDNNNIMYGVRTHSCRNIIAGEVRAAAFLQVNVLLTVDARSDEYLYILYYYFIFLTQLYCVNENKHRPKSYF